MANDELDFRIKRIYAAIGAVIETDMSKIKPKIIRDSHRTGIYQDFNRNLSKAELTNYLQSLISNIASFKYELNKWADYNGRDKTLVEKTFNDSQALRIIHDLWNKDKHADSQRESKSGLYPMLKEAESQIRLTTKPKKGSSVGLTFNVDGTLKILGNGMAMVIISSDILDKNGNTIGDLYDMAVNAIAAWENVLISLGVEIK